MKMTECIESLVATPIFMIHCSEIIEDTLMNSEFKQDDFIKCLQEMDHSWALDYRKLSYLTGLSSHYFGHCERFLCLEEIEQKTLNEAGYRLYGRIINGCLYIYVSDQEIRSYYAPKMSKLIFAILYSFEESAHNNDMKMEESLFFFYVYCQNVHMNRMQDLGVLRAEFSYWCPILERCYRRTHFFFELFFRRLDKQRAR